MIRLLFGALAEALRDLYNSTNRYLSNFSYRNYHHR